MPRTPCPDCGCADWDEYWGPVCGVNDCKSVKTICDERDEAVKARDYALLQIRELRKLLRRCFDAISQDGWPDLSLEVLAASKGDLTEKRVDEQRRDHMGHPLTCGECGTELTLFGGGTRVCQRCYVATWRS